MSTEEISPPWAILATSWLTKQSVCWAAIGRKSRTTISASDVDNNPSLSCPRICFIGFILLNTSTAICTDYNDSHHTAEYPSEISTWSNTRKPVEKAESSMAVMSTTSIKATTRRNSSGNSFLNLRNSLILPFSQAIFPEPFLSNLATND